MVVFLKKLLHIILNKYQIKDYCRNERSFLVRIEEQEKKTVEIPEAEKKYIELDLVIEKSRNKNGSIIEILHNAQEIFSYIPREVQIYIAEKMGKPFSEIYGIVSFYSLFTMKLRGKYTIEICMGTACYVKGAEEILNKLKNKLDIEPGEISQDGKFTIETTRCIGACSLAPVVTINGDVYSKVNPDEIEGILDKYS